MERDALIDRLNDLIRLAEDSHLSLQRASEDARDEGLKALLDDIAAQRGGIVRDLQRRVAAVGGAPEATGTLMGGARRMVAEIGAAIGARDDDAILAAAVADQEAVLTGFEEALDMDVPAEVKVEVNDHMRRVREDRDRLAAYQPPQAAAKERA